MLQLPALPQPCTRPSQCTMIRIFRARGLSFNFICVTFSPSIAALGAQDEPSVRRCLGERQQSINTQIAFSVVVTVKSASVTYSSSIYTHMNFISGIVSRVASTPPAIAVIIPKLLQRFGIGVPVFLHVIACAVFLVLGVFAVPAWSEVEKDGNKKTRGTALSAPFAGRL